MMTRRVSGATTFVALFALAAGALFAERSSDARRAVAVPRAVVDEAGMPGPTETAVFAGGCFWGIQAVFQHVKGVLSATSGYSGGWVEHPSYEQVSSGRTGHAESVRVTFDPTEVSYTTLLRVFFSVAHDPTELNRQGPDVGTQYRSAIFYTSDAQKHAAEAYIAQLDASHAFAKPIVTRVEPFKAFWVAESYHQNFAELHPDNPYIAINDLPKVANLEHTFPDLYTPHLAAHD